MLGHYIKVGIRNLRKYPAQSIISVLGLAAGFVSLSFSALWMHYENTYDTMHKDHERIYTLQLPDLAKRPVQGKVQLGARIGYYEAFATDFPEIEAATCCIFYDKTYSVNGWPAEVMAIDSTFTRLFDLPLVDGDYDFLYNNHEIALNEKIVNHIFPNDEEVVGRMVNFLGNEYEIGAIVRDYGTHSIFQYDVLALRPNNLPKLGIIPIFVKLHATADAEAFADKILNYALWENEVEGIRTYPIRHSHRVGGSRRSLGYGHLQSFVLCSLLLTACALLNFLLLYLMRLRGKARDMALRIVHGATHGSLLRMLLVEVLIVLLAAMLLGILGIEWVQSPFMHFANIDERPYFLVGQALWILPAIVVACLVISTIPVAIVRRNTLRGNLAQSHKGNFLRSVSVGIQLAAAILLLFCTATMMRQLHSMQNDNYGYKIKDKALLYVRTTESLSAREEQVANGRGTMELRAAMAQELRRMPMVTHVMEHDYDFNSGTGAFSAMKLCTAPDQEAVTAFAYVGIRDIANPSYGMTVLEGALPSKEAWSDNELIITESLCHALGLGSAVGHTLYSDNETYTVAAVIKDIRHAMLSDKPELLVFLKQRWGHINYVVIDYQPGMRDELSTAVADMMKQKHADVQYTLKFAEDVLAEKMESERNLMFILGFISAVCILVAVFGVYSIVTLACAQRRKEIALRKIHGATLRDILSIFIKEYGFIVLAASAVAFPIGYIFMKEWVAQYVKQAPFVWWIYAVIFLAIVLLIAFSVGSRVWQTARENPAEVIKRGN